MIESVGEKRCYLDGGKNEIVRMGTLGRISLQMNCMVVILKVKFYLIRAFRKLINIF